jgi:hypothetical protein
MQDLNDKVTSGTLTAAEWNEVPSELQNIIEAWGQALTTADLDQLGKGLAAYAAASQFYTGSGPADAYVATRITGIQAPPNYFDGMVVRFRATNANTGASTVNVDGLGVKNITREDGAVLAPSDIATTRDTWLRFDLSNDRFNVSRWSSDELVALQGSPANLKIGHLVTTDVTTITLSPGTFGNIVMAINGKILTRSADLIFILDDFGVGGSVLDVGSEAVSTAYYLYIDDIAGVMTPVISVTPPVLPGAAGVVGYHPTRTDELCIGSFWNDAGEDIVNTIWGPGQEVRFINMDGDHQISPSATAAVVWKTQAVNLPETASHIILSAHGESPSASGLLGFAVGNATGAVTALANRISAMGTSGPFCLYATVWDSGGDINGFGLAEMSIPVTVPASPQFSYAITRTLNGTLEVNVLGYRDHFAPSI